MNCCKHSYSFVPHKYVLSLRVPHGWTIVELLVVITVIAVLIALILPLVSNLRSVGDRTIGISNLRTLTTAGLVYASEHEDYLPNTYFNVNDNPQGTGVVRWFREIHPYVYGPSDESSLLVDGTFRSPYFAGYESYGREPAPAAWGRIDFINVHMWRQNTSSPWIRMNIRQASFPSDMPFLMTGYNDGAAGLTNSNSFRRYCYHPHDGGAAPTVAQLPKGTAWVYRDSLLVSYADGHVKVVPYQADKNMFAVVFNQR